MSVDNLAVGSDTFDQIVACKTLCEQDSYMPNTSLLLVRQNISGSQVKRLFINWNLKMYVSQL